MHLRCVENEAQWDEGQIMIKKRKEPVGKAENTVFGWPIYVLIWALTDSIGSGTVGRK
jgi:hypothetical protein